MTRGERFWSKVNKAGPVFRDLGSCWLWTGALESKGYGTFWDGGRLRPAHRVPWESVHGPVPEGMELDHLCRRRACVRETHVEGVTHRENMMRGEGVAAQNARKTACPRCGRAFRIRESRRHCPFCHAAAKTTRERIAQALAAQEW